MTERAVQEELIHGDYIVFDGTEYLSYQGLLDRYTLSPYGRHHAAQPPRYHQHYDYDFGQMIADLGDDVHPVRHMSHTEEALVRPFIEAQNVTYAGYYEPLSINEIIAMRTGARLHDIGECEHPLIEEKVGYIVGDVSWEVKVEADHDMESPVRRVLYDELYPDMPPELLKLSEKVIVKGQDNPLGEAFNVVERIGYYQTAMRAGELALRLAAQEEAEPSRRFLQLSRLAIKVTNNHHDFLESQKSRYAYAGRVLDRHGRLHEKIHSGLVFTEEAELPHSA